MAEGPTFASVTDTPCTCGYLQRSADDPHNPIVFDPTTAEFEFTYGVPGSDGLGRLVIYHCPFCGGAAPRSKRHLLFAVISPEEEARLAKLLRSVTSIATALQHLGTPDQDDPSGTRTEYHEAEGRPPVSRHHRTLVYERLSSTVDVCVTERPDGTAGWQLMGKYLGPPEIAT